MSSSSRGRRTLVASVVAAAALSLAASAAAQAPRVAGRPQGALFGGGVGENEHLLVVSGDVSGGIDFLKATDQTGELLVDRQGGAGSGVAGIEYGFNRGWFSASARGASAARYFEGQGKTWSTLNFGGGGATVNFPLTRRTTLTGRANTVYQPVSASTLFPDLFQMDGAAPLPTDFDLATPLEAYLSSDVGVGLSHMLSRRSSLSAEYLLSLRGPLDGDGQQRVETIYAGFGRTLARGLSLRLGYGRVTSENTLTIVEDIPVPGEITNQMFDLGVDFNRSLSFSRETTLSFSTGSVAMSDGETTHFDITGDVNLLHQMGRSWTTGVSYRRGADFRQTFALPTLSDSLSFSLRGEPLSRLSFTSGAGMTSGQIGLADSANAYRAYQGSVGLTLSLTRLIHVTAGYAYYRYQFDTTDLLQAALATRVRRHVFQIGTGVSLPLISRARRSNGSR